MKIEEIHGEEWYALFAPDGSIQGMTLAPAFATCAAQVSMMHKAGFGISLHKLLLKGFKIMPVLLTVTANGDENKAFTSSASPN